MSQKYELLISESEIAKRVEALALEVSPLIKPDAVCVALLTGAIWFAADLTRALSRLGHSLCFDALWLSSYEDGRTAKTLKRLAGLQRDLKGRQVLLIDDVLDTGSSLAWARSFLKEQGVDDVISIVFARKPAPKCHSKRADVDFSAWEAPDLFLVGYGLDDAGYHREKLGIWALIDEPPLANTQGQ
jgi:hypoxanthine phosphoribosyltransferase